MSALREQPPALRASSSVAYGPPNREQVPWGPEPIVAAFDAASKRIAVVTLSRPPSRKAYGGRFIPTGNIGPSSGILGCLRAVESGTGPLGPEPILVAFDAASQNIAAVTLTAAAFTPSQSGSGPAV